MHLTPLFFTPSRQFGIIVNCSLKSYVCLHIWMLSHKPHTYTVRTHMDMSRLISGTPPARSQTHGTINNGSVD